VPAPYDIFIVHSGQDRAPAEALYAALAQRHRVFLDSASLTPGDLWDTEIPRALETAQVIAVLISSRTEGHYYVQEDIAAAIDLLRHEDGRHRVVPVYLDGTAAPQNVPYGLRRLHGVFAAEGRFPRDVVVALERAVEASRRRARPTSDPLTESQARLAVPLEAELEVDGAALAIFEDDCVQFGRFPKTGVVLDHPSVSRRHASFALSRAGLEVTDLKSKNGTFVNGRRVVDAHLCAGDVVRFGHSGPEVLVRRAPVAPGLTETDEDVRRTE
jgi:hypothetical protein